MLPVRSPLWGWTLVISVVVVAGSIAWWGWWATPVVVAALLALWIAAVLSPE